MCCGTDCKNEEDMGLRKFIYKMDPSELHILYTKKWAAMATLRGFI